MLVLEDIHGVSVHSILEEQDISLAQILKVAIGVAEGLHGLYKANIIHKNICPRNVIVNFKQEQYRLIGFGNSSLFAEETIEFDSSKSIRGDLHYISPEQTGRTKQTLDYRSDLYSLGVMLYEMVTGQLPFHAEDDLGLISHHLSTEPTPPIEIAPNVPEVVSKIVLKLLEKIT